MYILLRILHVQASVPLFNLTFFFNSKYHKNINIHFFLQASQYIITAWIFKGISPWTFLTFTALSKSYLMLCEMKRLHGDFFLLLRNIQVIFGHRQIRSNQIILFRMPWSWDDGSSTDKMIKNTFCYWKWNLSVIKYNTLNKHYTNSLDFLNFYFHILGALHYDKLNCWKNILMANYNLSKFRFE